MIQPTMHCRRTTVYTTTVKGTKIKGVNMSSMCFFLSLGWVRPENFVDITSNIFSPEATGEEASNFIRYFHSLSSSVLLFLFLALFLLVAHLAYALVLSHCFF